MSLQTKKLLFFIWMPMAIPLHTLCLLYVIKYMFVTGTDNWFKFGVTFKMSHWIWFVYKETIRNSTDSHDSGLIKVFFFMIYSLLSQSFFMWFSLVNVVLYWTSLCFTFLGDFFYRNILNFCHMFFSSV